MPSSYQYEFEVGKEVEILSIFSKVNHLMSHFETDFRVKVLNLEVAFKNRLEKASF